MRILVVLLGLAAAIGLAMALSGRSPTAPERAPRSVAGPAATAPFAADTVDWLSWSEDEAVDRLVDAPLKWTGLRPYAPNDRVALKPVIERAERRVRSVVRDARSGTLAAGRAGDSLEAISRDYLAALQELSGER